MVWFLPLARVPDAWPLGTMMVIVLGSVPFIALRSSEV